MKRATIKDIAQLVGVNPSTISRALHDHHDISIELRKKIKDVAKELNYIPNVAALNLKNKSSKVIALIVPKISMHFVPSVINGISTICNKEGYKLMILSSEEDVEKEIENIKISCHASVDGILISLSNQTTNLNHFSLAEDLGISVVLFDKTIQQEIFDEIIIDDYKVGADSATYLINKKCKHIIGIFGNEKMSITQNRLKGFTDELNKHSKIQVTILHANSTFEAKKKLGNMDLNSCDGIFAMSDEIMLGVNSALFLSKRKKITSIAISDGLLPDLMTPPFTYYKHCGNTLGELAAKKLIEKIHLKQTQGVSQKIYMQVPLMLE